MPESSMVYQHTLTPEETTEYLERPDIVIEDAPRKDFNNGRLAIQRQFLMEMQMADGLKGISPEAYGVIAAEASANMQARMTKLKMKLDTAEMQLEQIRQDPNMSNKEQFLAKYDYYSKNPVYKPPALEEPFSPEQALKAQVWSGIETAEPTEPPSFKYAVGEGSWQDWYSGTPVSEKPEKTSWWSKLFGRKKETPPAAETPVHPIIMPGGKTAEEVKPSREQIDEYNRLGGSSTAAGRKYARDFIEAKKKPAIPVPETTIPKPAGYPDAVWNEQYKSWTITRNGKLMIWKP